MPDSHGRPKAADITDEEMLRVIHGWRQDRDGLPTWYCLANMVFHDFPAKVVQAKLRSLHKRGLAQGCVDCGCWAWEITEAGRERIAARV
jgi:hypothetical protein